MLVFKIRRICNQDLVKIANALDKFKKLKFLYLHLYIADYGDCDLQTNVSGIHIFLQKISSIQCV